MKTAIINVKIEPEVKTRAQKIADEMGFALGSLINGFLHNLIKTKRVEFIAYEHEEPSEFMIKALREAEEEPISPRFDNADDAIAWLKNPKRKYAN